MKITESLFPENQNNQESGFTIDLSKIGNGTSSSSSSSSKNKNSSSSGFNIDLSKIGTSNVKTTDNSKIGASLLGEEASSSSDTTEQSANKNSTLGILGRGLNVGIQSVGKGVTSAIDNVLQDAPAYLVNTITQKLAENNKSDSNLQAKAIQAKKNYEKAKNTNIFGEKVHQWEQNVDERQQAIWEDNPDSKLAEYTYKGTELAESVGRMLPSIAASYATAGLGGALAGATTAGATMAEAAGAATAAAKATQIASQAVGLGTMWQDVYVTSLDDSVNQGYDYNISAKKAFGDATLEIATEMLFGGIAGTGKGVLNSKWAKQILESEATEGVIKKYGVVKGVGLGMARAIVRVADVAESNTLKGYMANAFGEAAEEMISEVVSPFIERATTNPDADGATFGEILEAGIGGALVSFALFPTTRALGKIQDKKMSARIASAQLKIKTTDPNARFAILEDLVNDSVLIGSQNEEALNQNLNMKLSDLRSYKDAVAKATKEKNAPLNDLAVAYEGFLTEKGRATAQTVLQDAVNEGITEESVNKAYKRISELILEEDNERMTLAAARTYREQTRTSLIENDATVKSNKANRDALISELETDTATLESKSKELKAKNAELEKINKANKKAKNKVDTTELEQQVASLETELESLKQAFEEKFTRVQEADNIYNESIIGKGTEIDRLAEQAEAEAILGPEVAEGRKAQLRAAELAKGFVLTRDENGNVKSQTVDERKADILDNNTEEYQKGLSEYLYGRQYDKLRKYERNRINQYIPEQVDTEIAKTQEDFRAQAEQAVRNVADKLNAALKSKGVDQSRLKVEVDTTRDNLVAEYNAGTHTILLSGKYIYTEAAAEYYLAHEFLHGITDLNNQFMSQDGLQKFYADLDKAMAAMGYDYVKWYEAISSIYNKKYLAQGLEMGLTGDKLESFAAKAIENEVYARFMSTAFASKGILRALAVNNKTLLEDVKKSLNSSASGELVNTVWDMTRLAIMNDIDEALATPVSAELNQEEIDAAETMAFKRLDPTYSNSALLDPADNMYSGLAEELEKVPAKQLRIFVNQEHGLEKFLKTRGISDEEIKFSDIMDDETIKEIYNKTYQEQGGEEAKKYLISMVNYPVLDETILGKGPGFDGAPQYSSYTTKDASNYREVLFRLHSKRNSDGTYEELSGFNNQHYDYPGTVVHSRIYDTDTSLGNTLFIEELQSDYYNDLRKGYIDTPESIENFIKSLPTKVADEKALAELDTVYNLAYWGMLDANPEYQDKQYQLMNLRKYNYLKGQKKFKDDTNWDSITDDKLRIAAIVGEVPYGTTRENVQEKFNNTRLFLEDKLSAELKSGAYSSRAKKLINSISNKATQKKYSEASYQLDTTRTYEDTFEEIYKANNYDYSSTQTDRYLDEIIDDAYDAGQKELEHITEFYNGKLVDAENKLQELRKQETNPNRVPYASPEKIEGYALKRLLRLAVDENYDAIAWANGKVQQDLWGELQDYGPEYDRRIPEFFKKYLSKYGDPIKEATVDLEISRAITGTNTNTYNIKGVDLNALGDDFYKDIKTKGQPRFSFSRFSDTQATRITDQVLKDYNDYVTLQGRYNGDKFTNKSIIRGGKRQSQLASKVMDSDYISPEFRGEMIKNFNEGVYSYTVHSDKVLDAQARKYLDKFDSPEAMYTAVKANLANKNHKITDLDIYAAEILVREGAYAVDDMIAKDQDYSNQMKATQELFADLCIEANRNGRNLRLFGLLKKLTPEGRLYYLQKLGDSMYSDFVDQLGNSKIEGYLYKKKNGKVELDAEGNPKRIKISDDLIEKMKNCKTQAEMDAVEKEIIANIAEQVPTLVSDRVIAWRYLAMLGNPRTHIRNIVSNVTMGSINKAKNVIKGRLEDYVFEHNESLKGITKGRTRTANHYAAEAREALAKIADASWTDGDSETALNGGKLSSRQLVRMQMKKFGNSKIGQFLNMLDNINTNGIKGHEGTLLGGLEGEDYWSGKRAYRDAFIGYCEANGLTAETFNSKTAEVSEQFSLARDYAVKVASEATFHEANWLADALTSIEKKSGMLGKLIVGGLVPYKKVPLNILKLGIKYSPYSVGKGVANLYSTLKLGTEAYYSEFSENTEINKAEAQSKFTKSVTDAIDNISAGLTGTGIMLLGYFLAHIGLLRGAEKDKDSEEYYDEMLGDQPFSINIAGYNATLDWLTPACIPLFSGVAIKEMADKDKEIDTSAVVDLIADAFDPVMNLSVLQGLNDAISGYDSSLGNVIESSITSYAGQFIPTIFGQVARTVDPTRRTTYAPKEGTTLGKDTTQFLYKMRNKIPGLSYENEPYVDQWGRQEVKDSNPLVRFFNNAINPAYVRKINRTAADDVIASVYSQTKDAGVIPKTAESSFTINNKTYYLSEQEYTVAKTTVGQISFNSVMDLINQPGFTDLTSEQQADLISSCYTFAKKVAKTDYATANNIPLDVEASVEKILNAVDAGLSLGQALYVYYMANQIEADKDSDGETVYGSKKEKTLLLYARMGLSNDQIEAISNYTLD